MKPCTDEFFEYYADVTVIENITLIDKIISSVTALICIIIVFSWHKCKGMTTFVIILWILIIITVTLNLISGFFWEGVKLDEQNHLAVQTYYLYLMFYLLVHYIFAMEYFKAALNLPIIMNLFSPETEAKLKRSSRIIWCTNVCFWTMVIGWLVIQELYEN